MATLQSPEATSRANIASLSLAHEAMPPHLPLLKTPLQFSLSNLSCLEEERQRKGGKKGNSGGNKQHAFDFSLGGGGGWDVYKILENR